MQLIRRIYLYAMSGVTLAVLAVGLRFLLEAVLDTIGIEADAAFGGGSNRERLSLAGAMIGVGLPAWAIHWGLVRRSLQSAEAEEERGSTVRAFFLTVVLGVALVFIVNAAIDVSRTLLDAVLGVAAYGGLPSLAGSCATLLVAGAAWGYHAAVRRSDMARGSLVGGAAWWPRVYLHGAMLVSLIAGLQTLGGLIESLASDLVGPQPAFGDPGGPRFLIASQVSGVVVLGLVFAAHAWWVERLLADRGWRGASERPARVRVAFFGLTIAAAAFFAISDLAGAARAILVQVLGAPAPELGPIDAEPDVGRAVAVGVLSAIPWLAAGQLARLTMLAEAGRAGLAGRVASVARLDEYVPSLVGLAFGATALGWLLGLAIDVALGGDRTRIAGSWTYELSAFLPNAALGVALWAWGWSRAVRRVDANPAEEAESDMRRAALLLILAISLIAVVTSLALILYRIFGSLLGIPFGESIASALSTPLGALIVAGSVAIYHGLLVRLDARRRAIAAGTRAVAGPAGPVPPAAPAATRVVTTGPEPLSPIPEGAALAPAPESPGLRRRLVLTAASDADIDAAIAAVRSALPPGASLAAE